MGQGSGGTLSGLTGPRSKFQDRQRLSPKHRCFLLSQVVCVSLPHRCCSGPPAPPRGHPVPCPGGLWLLYSRKRFVPGLLEPPRWFCTELSAWRAAPSHASDRVQSAACAPRCPAGTLRSSSCPSSVQLGSCQHPDGVPLWLPNTLRRLSRFPSTALGPASFWAFSGAPLLTAHLRRDFLTPGFPAPCVVLRSLVRQVSEGLLPACASGTCMLVTGVAPPAQGLSPVALGGKRLNE